MEHMNSIDEWLDDESNAQMHHEVLTGIDNLPFILAFDICNRFLEKNDYLVFAKERPPVTEVCKTSVDVLRDEVYRLNLEIERMNKTKDEEIDECVKGATKNLLDQLHKLQRRNRE